MERDSHLTSFERRVLDRLLEGRHPTLAGLRAQVPHVRAARRTIDASGFVVELGGTDPVAPAGDGRSFQVLDVYGRVAGLDHDVGFILFVEEGRLARIEGQPLEGDWPEDRPGAPRLERLFFVHPRIEGGSEMVETGERDLAWALGLDTESTGVIQETQTSLTGRHVLADPSAPASESPRRREPPRNPGGTTRKEEPMDESTKVFLDPELTQKVPRDVLEQGNEPEKDDRRVREPEGGGKDSPENATQQPEPEDRTTPQTAPDSQTEAGSAPAEELSARRLVYLVAYNVFLGTLLTLALVFLLPRAPYMADLSDGPAGLASGAVRTHLTSSLLLVALAGAAGALLANLWGLVRNSGGGFSFPGRLEIPFYIRPLAGALQGLLLFFALHLALSALTMGTFTLAWVTLPGRMAYVALAFATGFGVEEVTAKLREIARTVFSLRSGL